VIVDEEDPVLEKAIISGVAHGPRAATACARSTPRLSSAAAAM
jgi:hypothetical protein